MALCPTPAGYHPAASGPVHPAIGTLHEFLTRHHCDIVARVRGRAQVRSWPSVTGRDDDHGASVLLPQLAEILRLARTPEAVPSAALVLTAARHGAELREAGCTVAHVVHDFADICQTITEIALEQHVPLTAAELRILNRCLGVAIAEAVTEHARLSAEQRDVEESERLGQAASEMRDRLSTALLAYDTLKRGGAPVALHAGAVLGRNLVRLGAVLDGTLAQVRLAPGMARPERLGVSAFIEDIATTALLHASDKGIRLHVEPVAQALAIDADSQLLTSAVMNVLQNAFEHTPRGGAVALKAYAEGECVIVEVQDACGGFEHDPRPGHVAAERLGSDRADARLGLSIARRVLRAHDGEVTIRNVRGRGCTFALRLPLSLKSAGASPCGSGA